MMESNSSLEKIAEREQQLLTLVDELKNACFGLYLSLDEKLLVNHECNEDAVLNLVDGFLDYAEEDDADALDLYQSFYKSAIYFLYAECNWDDRIWLSIRKIAKTFVNSGDSDFEDTVFGIMCETAKKRTHYGAEKVAYELMLKELPNLEKRYNAVKDGDRLNKKIKKMTERYMDANGITCLTKNDAYQAVTEMMECNIASMKDLIEGLAK